MKGLLGLLAVALLAYRSGHQQGQSEGFQDGVGKAAGAFISGLTRSAE